MLRTIDRYVIREVLAPFAIVLLVFTFMLLMDPIMGIADKLIAKGVAFSVVVRVLPTLFPQALALTIPMALLVGLLIALGRLSEDREWVALQACGVSVYRLLRPIALLSVLAWATTSYVLLEALPDANQAFREITIPVVMDRAESDIKPRVFFQDFPNRVLYVRDVLPDGKWRDVFVWDASRGEPTVSVAQTGRMVVDRGKRTVQLVLEEGTQHAGPADKYQVQTFKEVVQSLDPSAVFTREKIQKGANEMTIGELRAREEELRKQGIPSIDEPMALQQKFSIPVACLVFALIGLALGVNSRKDGKMASFVLGIAVIFVYYILMWTAASAAKAQFIPAWLARWVPNIVLAPVGLALLVWRDRFTDRGWRLPWPARPGPAAPRVIEAARSVGRRARLTLRVPHLGLPRPRLLDWYLSKLYLRVVALTFGGLIGLFYIAEFIDLSDKVFKGRAKPALLFLYYCYKTPYFAYYVIPIAGLIATLVTLGLLTRNSELVVMKACGISVYRAALPLVVFALVGSGALFFLEENVLATSNRRWRALQLTFKGIYAPTADLLNRGWIVSRDGRSIYHYDSFNAQTGELINFSTFMFDPASWRLVGRSQAARARVAPQPSSAGNATWIERDGWAREFPAGAQGKYAAFRERATTLEEVNYFGDEAPDAERMNYFDLKRYVAELRAGGFNVMRASVDLQRKVAFPFVAVVMALIAVPFAVSMGRRGTMYGVGLGIILSILYWVTSQVFAAFGAGGLLGPVLAAWAPNILFVAAAFYLWLNVRT
jgi:LPS export ABC transporter permease LptG/LPS export ABC transporter permease LptF